MAKTYILKERGTGATLYPQTIFKQVYGPDGRNLEAVLPDMQEQINSKQPSEPGKGLSANDYTDTDKSAVEKWTEWESGQFGLSGAIHKTNGQIFNYNSQFRRTPYLVLDKEAPIKLTTSTNGDHADIAFFDANGKFISAVKFATVGGLSTNICDPSEFPADAIYFIVSTVENPAASVSNSPTLEAVQGAAAQAIQASKVALFDDMWKAAVGTLGKVDHLHVDEDEKPTPYYLNGLWLTYEEAVEIDSFGIPTGILDKKFSGDLKCRTFYPYRRANIDTTAVEAFAHNYSVEVIAGSQIKSSNISSVFMNCRSLRSVPDLDLINNGLHRGVFQGCVKLESLTIFRLGGNMDVRDCPLISLESWQNIISRATNTAVITITVHADVYAKLTGNTTNAAAAALSADELAQWGQVLTDALARNISFATV